MSSTPPPQARCAVRGSINNDEYFYVHHISNPGETISSTAYKSRVGGKGANQAIAITRAGGKADLYATVGKDGGWVKEKVREFAEGLEDGIRVDERTVTGRAIIQVAENGENSIILFPGANYSTLHEDLWASQEEHDYFPSATHLLLQNEIPLSSTLRSLHLAHTRGSVTIFNPSPMPNEEELRTFPWKEVKWLVVNEGEAGMLWRVLSGKKDDVPEDDNVLLRELISIPTLKETNIICTLGPRGVLAFLHHLHRSEEEEKQSIYVPAATLRGTMRDTTGAGDCFLGYFVAGLMGLYNEKKEAEGEEDIRKVLEVCVQAAGMCVEREGTIEAVPGRAEVEERMRDGN